MNLPNSKLTFSNKGFGSYHFLLAGSKLLKAIGIFLTYDVLKILHLIHFLFLIKAISAAVFLGLQKPISSGGKLSKSCWMRIVRHGIIGIVIDILWLVGLSLCGPFRFILLYEHHEFIVIGAASALYASTGGPTKVRGAFFFIVGVLSLLLFDHDSSGNVSDHPEGQHTHFITHNIYKMINWFGLSDHKGGVTLLAVTLCLQAGYSALSRNLAASVGGSKRLHALSTMVSAIIAMPFSLITFISSESSSGESVVHLMVVLLFITLSMFILDIYVPAVCVNKMGNQNAARYSSLLLGLFGLLFSLIWNHPSTTAKTTLHKMIEPVSTEHMLSGGVIASAACFFYAVILLTNQERTAGPGQLVGYSAAGLPLYTRSGEEQLLKPGASWMLHCRDIFKQVFNDDTSRRIFYFLCVNLSFTGVELLYGVWTNSLGLISDGFHMLFDSSALVMGLSAAMMSRWQSTRLFSFGYDRVEVLSGFINALFLIAISGSVFLSAIERLLDPPTVSTERLLTVSVAGFFVNLIGIFALGHAHSHGGGSSHGHSHAGGSNHGHSHAHGHSHTHSHGHSHNHKELEAGSDCHHENTNMQGVYLHVLADTLGSVGVIVSSLLIQQYGWYLADPICSIFISLLIFHSVLPLIKDTLSILTLKAPQGPPTNVDNIIKEILRIDGVNGVKNPYIWQHTSQVVCLSTRICIDSAVTSEQNVISQVSKLCKQFGIEHSTAQIETNSFEQHMLGMGNKLKTDCYIPEQELVNPAVVIHTI